MRWGSGVLISFSSNCAVSEGQDTLASCAHQGESKANSTEQMNQGFHQAGNKHSLGHILSRVLKWPCILVKYNNVLSSNFEMYFSYSLGKKSSLPRGHSSLSIVDILSTSSVGKKSASLVAQNAVHWVEKYLYLFIFLQRRIE